MSEVAVKTNTVINLAETSTTIYAGAGFFEMTVDSNDNQDLRHILSGPDGTIGIHTIRTVRVGSDNVAVTDAQGMPLSGRSRFWFKDHLGSPASEYNLNALNIIPMSFDSWGLRRKSASGVFGQALNQNDLGSYDTSRGYTGHEHLDEVGLIHMNGRIYDPMIGRFLQADPIITEPYNSQSFNRYAYVLNNPLVYTDPSGYSFWTKIRRPLLAIAVAVITQGAVQMWGAEAFASELSVMSALDGGAAAAQATINGYAAVAGGFAAGGVGGGNIQSAVAGALQAGALFGVGEVLGHTDAGFLKGNHAARIVAHATIGCVSSGVQGGKCGAGAASAGFAAFAGPVIETGNFAADLAGHAVAGGIGGALGGGSFGNGAVTGAFGYLFNKVASGCSDCSEDSARSRDDRFKSAGDWASEAWNEYINAQQTRLTALANGDQEAWATVVSGFAGSVGGKGRLQLGMASRLTGQDLIDAAAKVGYPKLAKDHPIKGTMQEKVFTNGKDFISQDRTQHTGPAWKAFDANGYRSGTWNLDMTKRIRN